MHGQVPLRGLLLNFSRYFRYFCTTPIMRFFLAAAVLCASTALAQFESDDYDDELQARDARNAVWRAAHGGKAPNYRGFEDMAQHYPGHPGKSFGMRHHARDVDDEDDIGDEEGFIDATSNFANNVARAVKGAYDHVGHKAEEAVKHAKAKAGHQDDWRQFQQGGQRGGRGPHGGSWNNPRDVDDEAEFDEDESSDIFARDVADDDDEFEYSQDIDWDPSTTGEDDEDAQLAERDVEDDADEPAATAFDDDDEELPDPKLQLEQEFDEGLVERDEDGEGIFERDAEAFNFYGRGKGRDHERPNHAEFEAWKKGMRHVFARDSGLDPEDEDLDGAYDPISDDPNLTDEEFYGDAEELEKRSALRTKDGITVDDDDEDDDDE